MPTRAQKSRRSSRADVSKRFTSPRSVQSRLLSAILTADLPGQVLSSRHLSDETHHNSYVPSIESPFDPNDFTLALRWKGGEPLECRFVLSEAAPSSSLAPSFDGSGGIV